MHASTQWKGMANIQKNGIPTFSNMFSQAYSCKRILIQRCTGVNDWQSMLFQLT